MSCNISRIALKFTIYIRQTGNQQLELSCVEDLNEVLRDKLKEAFEEVLDLIFDIFGHLSVADLFHVFLFVFFGDKLISAVLY